MKYVLSQVCMVLGAMLFKLQVSFIGHVKLIPGWVRIQVNFDPIQEIGPKGGDGYSFTRVR